MKKMTPWSLALVSLLVVVAGCSEHKATPKTTAPTPAATTAAPATSPAAPAVATAYTCPMHPAVVSAQLGKCPKCGMDLVAKK